GKAPKAGLLVKVDEAFLHCAKALIRSNLWAPATQIDRKSFPSMGKMLADQIGTEHSPEADEEDRKRQQKSLY
ncbi:MAG: pyridoxamine 5'-phosphate oxidase family protein, partial [SAR324 cluster bacterium]|nr:pyridoxamine 5'-phosphate oxidase family protein [SAR324 cluster bacterium]